MLRGLGFIKSQLGPELGAVDYYRCYLPLREVNKNDPDIEIQTVDSEMMLGVRDDHLLGMDFYHMSRMYGEGYEKLFDPIRESGAFTSFDVDDDLTEPYMWLGKMCEVFKNVLGVVDFVSVTTSYLAQKLARYTKREPTVIPNYLDVDWFSQPAERFVPGLTVGLAGTRWHEADWWPIYSILSNLENITPVLLGPDPGWIKVGTPGMWHIEQTAYVTYPQALSQFDIVLCPLEPNNEFNRSKSDVKALEVMAAGAVAVCSNAPCYQKLADTGAPIVIVNDQHLWGDNLDVHDVWYEAIRRLTQDEKQFRLDLSRQGKTWVKDHRDMNTIGWKDWSAYFHGIIWQV